MFDWLKRLLSDPPAASLPGDIVNLPTVHIHPEAISIRTVANPPPVEPTRAECIATARELMHEAVDMLDDHGLLFEEIEEIVGDAVGDYWEEVYGEDEEDDDDDWFSGEDDDDDDCDDDGCDCSIDCECPDCSDADEDFVDFKGGPL